MSDMKYNPSTGEWKEIYGPEVKKTKTPVQPKNKPDVPKTPKGGTSATSKKTKKASSAKKYREREFNLEGTAQVMPNPDTQARNVVEFMGLGNQFSGKYFVVRVRHTWSNSGYTQELEVKRNGFGGFTERKKTAAETNVARPTKEKVAPTSNARYVTVKKGDSLWSLAKKYYGKGSDYTKIATANNISNPNAVQPGQKLLIP